MRGGVAALGLLLLLSGGYAFFDTPQAAQLSGLPVAGFVVSGIRMDLRTLGLLVGFLGFVVTVAGLAADGPSSSTAPPTQVVAASRRPVVAVGGSPTAPGAPGIPPPPEGPGASRGARGEIGSSTSMVGIAPPVGRSGAAGRIVVGAILAIVGLIPMDQAPLYYGTVGYGTLLPLAGDAVGLMLFAIGGGLAASSIGRHSGGRTVTGALGGGGLFVALANFSQAYFQGSFGFQTLCESGGVYYNCTDTLAIARYHFDLLAGALALSAGAALLLAAIVVRPNTSPTAGTGPNGPYREYRVVEGDTVASIAQKFGIQPDRWMAKTYFGSIARPNQLHWDMWKQRFEIRTGQALRIPEPPPDAPRPPP